MPWRVLLNRRSMLSGVICPSGRLFFSTSSMVALKVASGAPLATSPPTFTSAACTTPSRGMLTTWLGRLTMAESAWVTKYSW
ncbi:hypothetical protein D3C80_1865070 [compost metagenome]